MIDLSFFNGKRVFLTGHTGFKGTWLAMLLADAGAELTGYSLQPNTEPSLFQLLYLKERVHSVIGDVRDYESLERAFREASPEIVLHLAAQPIVRDSYRDPRYTYETNVMGTVNLLDCVRRTDCVRSLVNVTTDKVYENKEWAWGYRETDALDGYDPYSNSKSCSELVTHSYAKSFLTEQGVAVSTVRAGNVIGGGDFARDRILPDSVRAALKGVPIAVRNANSIRPYQHVLDPVAAYLMIAAAQYEEPGLAGCYNVGPEDRDCVTTGDLVGLFCKKWGEGLTWENRTENGPHEANFLKLDCAKLRSTFDWAPVWHIEKAVEKTVEWSKVYRDRGDITGCVREQMREFFSKIDRSLYV